MDVGWVARRIDRDPEDTKDWMTVRNADVARRQDAEAAGRHAWEQATRSGQNLSAARLSDVVALGAHVLSQRDAGTTTPKRLSATPVIIGDPAPARPLLSPDTTRQDLAWRSLGFPAVRPSEFDSQAGSAAGPALAQGAGIVAGLFRGARHTGADALRTAFFAARAANPLDGALSAHGKSARDEIGATVGRLANYADDYISHPDHFGRDVRNTVHRVAVDMIPGATPEASTPEAEQLRRFRIGENQGELGFNGLLAIAAPASELGEMALQGSKAANVARFVAQGFAPNTAEYLASSYEGMGHHSLPRVAGWPAKVADSSFFLLKPPWMNRGRFYERHYAVDSEFHGARIRATAGGGSWSGNALGLKKYGPLGQFWFGTTTPLKTAAGAALVTNNAQADQVTNGSGPP